jgi:2-dehydro-3-deoxyphosphogluconate aldolase/(4S)-4-hydroxy-2-oxoglutarate aldolase
MHKWETLSRIVKTGLVAVVRATSGDVADRIARACMEGGVGAIEITFTVPGAHEVIAGLAKRFSNQELLIGAGTVLDEETARMAISAGAQFIVSPSLNARTAQLCRRYQISYMPGAATITEVVRALEEGADIVKVFPGEILGPAFVKAILGPLPHAPLMPTGGVSLDNAADWIQAGCVALGVGSNLTAGANMGNYVSITETARQFLAMINEARNPRLEGNGRLSGGGREAAYQQELAGGPEAKKR